MFLLISVINQLVFCNFIGSNDIAFRLGFMLNRYSETELGTSKKYSRKETINY